LHFMNITISVEYKFAFILSILLTWYRCKLVVRCLSIFFVNVVMLPPYHELLRFHVNTKTFIAKKVYLHL